MNSIGFSKRILIIAYPKSGTSWLTRLTAELLQSSIQGFLYSNLEDPISSDNCRKGDFEIFKGHQQLKELKKGELDKSKVIYIYRDPRDVSISSSHFFYSRELLKPFRTIPLSRKPIYLVKKILGVKLGAKLRRNNSINAILYGNEKIDHWLKSSWKNHVLPYVENERVLCLSYENLLDQPFSNVKKILKFLNLEMSEKDIQKAIEEQSFEKVKQKFKNDKKKFKFLRKGEKEQWRHVLSNRQKQMFLDSLSTELAKLGYQLN